MKINKYILLVLVCMAIAFCSCKSAQNHAAFYSLEGTHWTLTAINGESLQDTQTQPYILFSTDGKISGNLGCNEFFGTYYKNNNKLDINYTGSTKKLCGSMNTEKQFIAALKSDIKSYSIEGDVLIIKDNEKEVIRCIAQPNQE